jgi:hypothetical protein
MVPKVRAKGNSPPPYQAARPELERRRRAKRRGAGRGEGEEQEQATLSACASDFPAQGSGSSRWHHHHQPFASSQGLRAETPPGRSLQPTAGNPYRGSRERGAHRTGKGGENAQARDALPPSSRRSWMTMDSSTLHLRGSLFSRPDPRFCFSPLKAALVVLDFQR